MVEKIAVEPMTSTPQKRARRNATDLQRLVMGAHHIAGATDCVQKRRRETLVNLVPQTTDLDIDHVRLGVKVVVPDRLQQHRARDDLVLVPDQVLEQTKFPGL